MNYGTIKKIGQNPFVILLSVIGGFMVGIYLPNLGHALEPYGKIYLALLEFTLVPIIVASITLSVSRLIGNQGTENYVRRIIITMSVFMVIISAVSMFLAYILTPASNLLTSTHFKLREISTAASIVDRKLSSPIAAISTKPISTFILDAIPKNLFTALAESKIFQVLVLSFIIGLAIAYLKSDRKRSAQRFFETILEMFQSIISTITLWLPIGIFCLTAASTGTVGFETISQMGIFILKCYCAYIFIFFVCTIIIKLRSNKTLLETLAFLKVPVFVAFGTRSAIAPVPSQIEALRDKFKFESNLVELLVPLGAVLGRFGNIIYFGFLTIFVIQLYRFEPSASQILFIVLLTVLAGLSTTGASGILTLSLLTIVLDPLGLPLGAVLPLLIAVDTLIDPIRTLLTVYTNCANVALVSPIPGKT